MSTPDFELRLACARAMGARIPAPSVHVRDQMDAATAGAARLHERVAAALPFVEPGTEWYRQVSVNAPDERGLYLMAALLGCRYCPHLRPGSSPQPALARLPLHRVDCTSCMRTNRRPPADEADRCDVCGQRGVTVFTPFVVAQGPVLVSGDACPDCADVVIGADRPGR